MAEEYQLPNSEEAEHALLGQVILDQSLVHEALAELTPEDFYWSSTRTTFTAMGVLVEEVKEINPITIANVIGDHAQKVGGISWLSNLTYGLPHTTTLKPFISIIKEKSAKRKLAKVGLELFNAAKSDSEPTEQLFSLVDSRLDKIRNDAIGSNGFRSFMEVSEDVHKHIQDLREGKVATLPLGFPTLDKILRGGAYPGELYLIAGRTAKGKSSFAKQLVHFWASIGIPCAFVSCEMKDRAVFFRILSPEAGVPNWTIQPGISHEKLDILEQGLVKVANYPIWISDRIDNVYELKARIQQLVRSKKIKVVVVDYLQLLNAQKAHARTQERVQELQDISRTLKNMTLAFGISIFELAQFNRRANQKDMEGNDVELELSFLEGSGAIEKDADVAMFIDMEEYQVGQVERKAWLKIAKNRESISDVTIDLIYNGNYLLFREVETPLVLNRKDKKTEEMFEGKSKVSSSDNGVGTREQPTTDELNQSIGEGEF